ncbi:putative phosphatidylcholine:ceramide cholinephosphotransferase 3 [Trichinella pseudospiralis]|uniref:Putative phosphatidylcholine:ceramide cholinephosphotransferase 3 n=1 Tax=Trichinella pseudospiralis TaxID=6337 RepID=A0A0V0YDP9_TRIPS|nr:putative phosphatidylcholine:ceramide cholinephosphotransferase 3 [Trichinella pseudospiralis]
MQQSSIENSFASSSSGMIASSDRNHEVLVEFKNAQGQPISRNYPKNYKKLFISLVILFMTTYSNGLAIAYVNKFSKTTYNSTKPLNDITFSLFSRQRWAWKAADMTVAACAAISIIVILLHRCNTIVLRRMALLASMLYYFRFICIISTQLPPPFEDFHERCLEPIDIAQNFSYYLIEAGKVVFNLGTTDVDSKFLCGDTIYSGHTLVAVLLVCFVCHYCPTALQPWIPACSILLGISSVIFVIISRQHYTIDCIISVLLTLILFAWYHSWIMVEHQYSNKWKYLLMNILVYFEEDVPPGQLPNELAFPDPNVITMNDFFRKYFTIRR